MTYEEKLLGVISRFSGKQITSQTLFEMEKACEVEVWVHLPKKIRDSWTLHLGFSDTNPGQIDLCPRQIGSVPPAELEAALKEAFEERSPEARGGIAGVAMNFAGDVRAPAPQVAAQKDAPSSPSPTGSTTVEAGRSAVTISVGDGTPSPRAPSEPKVQAKDIAEQAKSLGIALPPNSSLLQPFLEALAAAIEYRARAEAAEAKLNELLKLV